MPQQRRFRRLGSATAVSAGTLALLFLGAPAANAASAGASGQPCKKGTDPASTIENWKCQLGNMREGLTPKEPATPPPPSKKPPLKESSTGKTTERDPSAGKPRPHPRPAAPGGTVPSGVEALPQSVPSSLRPPTPGGAPNVLPTPEVAAPGGALPPAGSGAEPRTRLISAVAASPRQGDQTIWVAAAAGLAGAVGALNLSVIGRRARRFR